MRYREAGRGAQLQRRQRGTRGQATVFARARGVCCSAGASDRLRTPLPAASARHPCMHSASRAVQDLQRAPGGRAGGWAICYAATHRLAVEQA
jgi:hypothetical protein